MTHPTRKAKRFVRLNTGRGFAWLCNFGLCHWAEPTKMGLSMKPSDEAVKVSVRIIRERDYRNLLRLAKRNAVNKQVTCALLQPSLCATET